MKFSSIRNPLVLFSSPSFSVNIDVPSTGTKSHHHLQGRDLCYDRYHSGYIGDSYRTTKLREKPAHMICVFVLWLKIDNHGDKRESHQLILKKGNQERAMLLSSDARRKWFKARALLKTTQTQIILSYY